MGNSTSSTETSMATESSARKYALGGDLGYVVDVYVGKSEQAEHLGSKEEPALSKLVIVLDSSGSMSAVFPTVLASIQRLVDELEVSKETPVEVITFNSVVKVYSTNVDDVRGGYLQEKLRAGGATIIAPVLDLLVSIFANSKGQAVSVVVISDGVIADRNKLPSLVQQAVRMKTHLNPALVSMTLVRLDSGYGQNYADTSGLACLSAFATTPQAPEVLDADYDVGVFGSTLFNSFKGNHNNDKKLFNLLKSAPGLQSMTRRPLVLASATSGAALKSFPGERPGAPVVGLVGAWTTVLADANVDAVRIGPTTTVPVEDMGLVQSESDIAGYLLSLLKMAKLWVLNGLDKERCDLVCAWANDLQAQLLANNAAATEALHGSAMTPEARLSVKMRAKALASSVEKSARSALHELRELVNAEHVRTLNSQQQADWLRSVGNDKTGRALARRAMGDDARDWHASLKAAIDHLARGTIGPDAPAQVIDGQDGDEPVSFYSRSTTRECAEVAAELRLCAEHLRLGDALTCLGAVGIPFVARVRNYVDPWTLRIQALCVGDSLMLSEADLCLMRSQGEGSRVQCPAHDHALTGVVPVITNQRDAYIAYTSGPARKLFEMQASAQIRGVVAPVPFDAIALVASALWHLLHTDDMSTAQRKAFDALQATLKHQVGTVYPPKSLSTLWARLCEARDARTVLTAEDHVTNVLRPIAALLRFGLRGEDAERILRALYGLETYHTARKVFAGPTHASQDASSSETTAALPVSEEDEEGAERREAALATLLGARLAEEGATVQPPRVPEPPGAPHLEHSAFAMARVVLPTWVPPIFPYLNLLEKLSGVQVADEDVLWIRAVAAVQALQAKKQRDRIDPATGQCALEDPSTAEKAFDFLTRTYEELFVRDYAKKLDAKHAAENALRVAETIDALICAPTMEDFENELRTSPIDSFSHRGFRELLDVLIATCATPLQTRKLGTLLVGRDLEDPTRIVFGRGNAWPGAWTSIREAMLQSDSGPEIFAMCASVRKAFGGHEYRGSGPSNRHGHSSAFPSFFGLGFASLKDMKQSVSDEEFQTYVQKHCIEKGCCLENGGKLSS